MKRTITLLICILTLTGISIAQLNYNPRKNSFRFGGGYANNDEAYGFAIFNEADITIWKNISAGPNIYFARTGYYLDSKNAISHFYGVDLNLYYTLQLQKSFSMQLGPGYTFRETLNSSPSYVDYGIYGLYECIPSTQRTGWIGNLNFEKGISDRWNIGLKMTYHPFGPMKALFYMGLYGGINF